MVVIPKDLQHLTIHDVAKILGCHTRTVRRMNLTWIPIRPGARKKVISVNYFEKYMAARTRETEALESLEL
ncbi:MAG: hypothetical protein HQM09_15080 [Candidatus Riflebacteria bacterium]|nr:hypothetical protein [Candidatus Riflebacteria bacterium]